MPDRGPADILMDDPKFKKEFDEVYFIEKYINIMLVAMEEDKVSYTPAFEKKVESALKALYKKNLKNDEA